MFRLVGTTVGIAVISISAYWGAFDYFMLSKANQRIQEEALELSEREFWLLLSREEAHRINVGFDGTWLLLGGIIVLLSNREK